MWGQGVRIFFPQNSYVEILTHGVHIHRGSLDKDLEERPCEDTGNRQSLQAKERVLGQIFPSEPSEGTNTANILVSDLEPPKPGRNTFLLFKPPGLR